MILNSFHPALRKWFQENLGEPTPAQAQAWPAIQKKKHTLISAPTTAVKPRPLFMP